MNKGRLSGIGGLVAVLVLVVAGAAFAVTAGTSAGVASDGTRVVIPTWPAFTMTYETNGITVGIGDDPSATTRETRRLDFVSKTHRTDTVLEAPTITSKVAGPQSRVGAYEQLRGRTVTEYEPKEGPIVEKTVPENVRYAAGSMMMPFPMVESGYAFTEVPTTATVCFQDRCVDNAVGLLYRTDNDSEIVFVNDARGIPLRMGHPANTNVFVVSEIRISDARQDLPTDD